MSAKRNTRIGNSNNNKSHNSNVNAETESDDDDEGKSQPQVAGQAKEPEEIKESKEKKKGGYGGNVSNKGQTGNKRSCNSTVPSNKKPAPGQRTLEEFYSKQKQSVPKVADVVPHVAETAEQITSSLPQVPTTEQFCSLAQASAPSSSGCIIQPPQAAAAATTTTTTTIADEQCIEKKPDEGRIMRTRSNPQTPKPENSASLVSKTSLKKACLQAIDDKTIMAKLVVKETEQRGRGVFADTDIKKGKVLCEFSGQLITLSEALRREEEYERQGKGCYMMFFQHGAQTKCVDPTEENEIFGVGRLVNHSQKNANADVIKVVHNKIPRIFLVASRDIVKGEEIFFDYGERREDVEAENPWLKD